MKEYIINKNDAGQRLDKFILKIAPSLPQSLLYKTIRKKDIKVNGLRTLPSQILSKDDVVELYLHSKFFKEAKSDFLAATGELTIVFEDENILIVNKPVGLLMHKDSGSNTENLTDQMLKYLFESGAYNPENELSFTPAFCNRLDRNTSGLVLAGKTFATLQIINEKIKNHEIVKKYLCQVSGVPKNKSAILRSYLKKDSTANKAIISFSPKPDFSPIETRYKLIASKDNTSILEVELVTGRFHQIRAQLASLGHPIVGDKKYGGSKTSGFQRLTAFYIGFNFKDDCPLSYLNGREFSIPATFS